MSQFAESARPMHSTLYSKQESTQVWHGMSGGLCRMVAEVATQFWGNSNRVPDWIKIVRINVCDPLGKCSVVLLNSDVHECMPKVCVLSCAIPGEGWKGPWHCQLLFMAQVGAEIVRAFAR
eukprot:6153829-Amphidinium_carterae.1